MAFYSIQAGLVFISEGLIHLITLVFLQYRRTSLYANFYLRIRIYAIAKKRQKLIICDDFAAPPSRICDLNFS